MFFTLGGTAEMWSRAPWALVAQPARAFAIFALHPRNVEDPAAALLQACVCCALTAASLLLIDLWLRAAFLTNSPCAVGGRAAAAELPQKLLGPHSVN